MFRRRALLLTGAFQSHKFPIELSKIDLLLGSSYSLPPYFSGYNDFGFFFFWRCVIDEVFRTYSTRMSA
jgi:hypothetical protein